MIKVSELAFKGLEGSWTDENEACRRYAGHMPTMAFQSIKLVRELEGISQASPIFWLCGKSGKIEPPLHLLQSDSACTQEGFSPQREMCYRPLALWSNPEGL